MNDLTDPYYTPGEVAERFKLDRETVLRKLRTKVWPGTKIGGVWRMTREDVRQVEQGNVTTSRLDDSRISDLMSRIA